MEREQLLKGALAWAEAGVPVFPCGRDKRPQTANGHHDASTDPAIVRFMFENCPEDTLIGAAMGKACGLFACDFDLYKPGAEDYMRSLVDRGLLKETQTHLTRSGGIHMIYRAAIQPNCKPHIGVEVKGEGGYIIVPPSPGYSIEREGISEADPLLIKELLTAQKASSTSSIDHLKRQVLSGKAFHDPLAQIAARRSAQGWAVERVQRELLDTLMASAASSPSHARHDRWQKLVNDENEELSRIVGTGNAKFNADSKTEKVRETVTDDLHRGLLDDTQLFFRRASGDSAVPEQPAVPELGHSEELTWPFADAGYEGSTSRDIRNQRYIAYPLLAERETVLIAAEPKVGKTAIALTIAAAVAQGKSITDKISIAESRPVLYFTLEGARAVELRLEAMRQDATNREQEVPDLQRLFVVDRPHSFLDTTQQEANCAKIALHNLKCKEAYGVELGLIVIDTLTKAMPGGDQNSVEDTSKLFDMIGKLRTFGVDATIVFIHHLSKQGNVRGSTNIEAEVDVVLGVEKVKDSSDVWMNIRRARSIDEDVNYRFAFRSVDLGTTVQGHRLAAPVVELVGNEVPTSGASVKDNVQWAKVNEALVTLGAGKHNTAEMVAVLHEFVDRPVGKRPDYKSPTVQKPLQALFKNRFSWAFGDWHLTIHRNADEDIIGIELRFTR